MKALKIYFYVTVLIFLSFSVSSAAANHEIIFPEGFMWGTATSSYQVEGGITNNDWCEFENKQGAIANGDKCGDACEQYSRYENDLDLALALNTKIYRMSIEWSRVEPSEGKFDENEINHYRQVLTAVKKRGMIPFVTLFHFCTPSWLAEKGGWANPDSAKYFERYSEIMARDLGDLVDYWTTQNETMGYLASGYLIGQWAPGKKNPVEFWKALSNLIKGHGQAYYAIKKADEADADGDGKNAIVGVVMNYAIVDAYNKESAANKFIAEKVNYFANHLFIDSITTGKADLSGIAGEMNDKKILLLPEMPNTLDYIGVNYYTRALLRMSVTNPMVGLGQAARIKSKETKMAGFEYNEMNWLIYPEGIYRAVMSMKKYGIPIYITENGIPDKTGKKRAKYIADHLFWLKKAIDDGAPVKGYIHWALLDNFEWAEGYWPRFGLYSVDYKTQKRTLNEGGAFYAEVCKNNGLTGSMYDSVYGMKNTEDKAKAESLELHKK